MPKSNATPTGSTTSPTSFSGTSPSKVEGAWGRNATFTPVNQSAVNTIGSDDMQNAEYYDFQGRKINDITSATGVIIVKREDGTTSKIIKR